MNGTSVENRDSPNLPQLWITQWTGAMEILFTIATLLGNFLFIGAVVVKKKLRTLANAFLVNLSLTDIFAAILVSSFSIDAYFRRGWYLGRQLCIAHNILHPVLLSISLYLTAFTALNRYIFIVHHQIYHRITNKVTVTLALLCAWAFPFALRAHVIANTSRYSPSAFRCRTSATQLEIALTMYIPSVITMVLYSMIFIYVRQSRRRIQSYPSQNNAGTHRSPKPQEVRMLKVLVIVFLLVLMGYLPYVFVINIYTALGVRPSPVPFILLYPCIHIAGVLNPILYGGSNKNFRAAYRQLLTGKLFYGNTGSSTATATTAADGNPRGRIFTINTLHPRVTGVGAM